MLTTIPRSRRRHAELVRRLVHAQAERDTATFLELTTPDVVLDYPIVRAGHPSRVTGHAEVRALLAEVTRQLPALAVDDLDVHAHEDPDRLTASFRLHGSGYDSRYLTTFTCRDSLVSRYQLFFDPRALETAQTRAPSQAR